MFTVEQLNSVPQLDQYEGSSYWLAVGTFNFSTVEVQEKLQHLNIYNSTGPNMLLQRILHTREGQTCWASHTQI